MVHPANVGACDERAYMMMGVIEQATRNESLTSWSLGAIAALTYRPTISSLVSRDLSSQDDR
jgi:hypothetical protein